MARTVERRRTVTRHVETQGVNEMKRNLGQIAEEIGRVRDQAQQEVGALEKIRGMLDVGYLNDLIRSIESLEERMEDLENEALQSNSNAGRLERDLGAEQERLAKLWDAYKIQEDELERVKRDYPLLEEKLFERDRTIENLRKDLSRLEPLARYKDEYDAMVVENRRLNNDLDGLEHDLETAQSRVDQLEGEVDSLRALETDQHRVGELEKQLEEEQERLAKLYRVYEDQEAEKKDLENRIAALESWARRVVPTLESACKSLESYPGS